MVTGAGSFPPITITWWCIQKGQAVAAFDDFLVGDFLTKLQRHGKSSVKTLTLSCTLPHDRPNLLKSNFCDRISPTLTNNKNRKDETYPSFRPCKLSLLPCHHTCQQNTDPTI
jgi:hypothetical protein